MPPPQPPTGATPSSVFSCTGRASPQALANSLWALATMSVLPSKAWMDEVFAVVAQRLGEFEPQALSSLLWSAATLGQRLPATLMSQLYLVTRDGLAVFPPQSLSNMIWAIAVSQPPPASSALRQPRSQSRATSAMVLAPPAPLNQQPPKPWADAFIAAFRYRLPEMTDQAVSNVSWALARLKVPVDAALASAIVQHMHALEMHGAEEGGGVNGQALSNCLWGLAKPGTLTLNAAAEDVLVSMVRRRLVLAEEGNASEGNIRSRGRSGTEVVRLDFRPAELASVVYSFAKLRHLPPDDVVRMMLDATLINASRCSSDSPVIDGESLAGSTHYRGRCGLGPQDLANTAWALSTLGVAPNRRWLSEFWSACCHQLPSFNTKDLAQLTYSMAKLGWRVVPEGAWQPEQRDGVVSGRGGGGAAANDRAKAGDDDMIMALPGAGLLLAEASAALPRCSSLDVANLCWGLAQMGLRPSQPWLHSLAEALLTRRGDPLQGSDLATAVWALGKMGYRPKPKSLLPVEGSLFRRMPTLKPRELAACAWAFSAMKYTPDVEWLDAFAAQVCGALSCLLLFSADKVC